MEILSTSDSLAKLSALNEAYLNLASSYTSANKAPLRIAWNSKTVWIDTDNQIVYRIGSPLETYRRVLVQRYLESIGLDVMLKETILPDLSTFGLATSQKLVSPVSHDTVDAQVLEKIQSQISSSKFTLLNEIFAEYGIGWYGYSNSGFDETGRLYIFDFIANLTVDIKTDKVVLRDKNRSEVYVYEL